MHEYPAIGAGRQPSTEAGLQAVARGQWHPADRLRSHFRDHQPGDPTDDSAGSSQERSPHDRVAPAASAGSAAAPNPRATSYSRRRGPRPDCDRSGHPADRRSASAGHAIHAASAHSSPATADPTPGDAAPAAHTGPQAAGGGDLAEHAIASAGADQNHGGLWPTDVPLRERGGGRTTSLYVSDPAGLQAGGAAAGARAARATTGTTGAVDAISGSGAFDAVSAPGAFDAIGPPGAFDAIGAPGALDAISGSGALDAVSAPGALNAIGPQAAFAALRAAPFTWRPRPCTISGNGRRTRCASRPAHRRLNRLRCPETGAAYLATSATQAMRAK